MNEICQRLRHCTVYFRLAGARVEMLVEHGCDEGAAFIVGQDELQLIRATIDSVLRPPLATTKPKPFNSKACELQPGKRFGTLSTKAGNVLLLALGTPASQMPLEDLAQEASKLSDAQLGQEPGCGRVILNEIRTWHAEAGFRRLAEGEIERVDAAKALLELYGYAVTPPAPGR